MKPCKTMGYLPYQLMQDLIHQQCVVSFCLNGLYKPKVHTKSLDASKRRNNTSRGSMYGMFTYIQSNSHNHPKKTTIPPINPRLFWWPFSTKKPVGSWEGNNHNTRPMDIPSLEKAPASWQNEFALKPPVTGNAPWEGRDDTFLRKNAEKMVKVCSV